MKGKERKSCTIDYVGDAIMLAPKQRRVRSPIESDRFDGRSKNRRHRMGGRVEKDEERMRSGEGENSPLLDRPQRVLHNNAWEASGQISCSGGC